MIKVIDIQNSITKQLKDKFPLHQIRVEDNKKDIETPAFYVSVRPILTTGSRQYKNKLVNVNIMYLSKNKTHAENIVMSEELEDLFHLTLNVRDRSLYIEDLSMSELDKVLNLGFTLDYNVGAVYRYNVDGGYDKDTMEYMEELEIEKGVD